MARRSLREELADILCEFTGQNNTQAITAMMRATTDLSRSDRDLIVDALRAAGRKPVAIRIPPDLRQRLLPEATDPAQQALEARILLAMSDAVNHLHERPPRSLLRPAHLLQGVDPQPDVLRLRLHPHAVGPLAAETLPRTNGEGLSGIPGLRYRQHRNHGELFLLGERPTARVILAGVDTEAWKAAVIFAEQSVELDPDDPITWHWHNSQRLTRPERDAIKARRRRFPGPAALASAVLRRYGLLATEALYLRAWTFIDRLSIEAPGPAVAERLQTQLNHPLFGLDAAEATDGRTILDQHTSTPGDQPWRLDLRRADLPDADADERLNESQRDPHGGWTAWNAISESRQRAACTGEELRSAVAGITSCPENSSGLDDCSPAQRDLRFVLALYTFNAGIIAAPPGWSGVHTITAYDIVVSPRFDELVLFTNAPDNLTGYFIGTDTGGGIPGMRIDTRPNGGTFRLLHLPTGGRLTITSRTETTHLHRVGTWNTRNWLTTSTGLTQAEKTELAATPTPTDAASQLLGALFTRISCTDPNGTWALGTWFDDPLNRTPPREHHASGPTRQLWGAEDSWELTWDDHPFPADIVDSLTDPHHGLPGTQAEGAGPDHTLTYKGATLRLGPWPKGLRPTR
ncbi:hypothetical protein [Longispora urticae]